MYKLCIYIDVYMVRNSALGHFNIISNPDQMEMWQPTQMRFCMSIPFVGLRSRWWRKKGTVALYIYLLARWRHKVWRHIGIFGMCVRATIHYRNYVIWFYERTHTRTHAQTHMAFAQLLIGSVINIYQIDFN